MKLLSFTFLLFVLLLADTPFTAASTQRDLPGAPAVTRIHASLRLSQTVLGIEVLIPTAIYSVQNLNTGASGTVINANLFDVVVEEGDVLYLNSFSLPLAIFYTVTAADITSGAIHVHILS